MVDGCVKVKITIWKKQFNQLTSCILRNNWCNLFLCCWAAAVMPPFLCLFDTEICVWQFNTNADPGCLFFIKQHAGHFEPKRFHSQQCFVLLWARVSQSVGYDPSWGWLVCRWAPGRFLRLMYWYVIDVFFFFVAAWLKGWKCWSVGLSVHHFGPGWNIATIIGWSAIIFSIGIHGPQKMNCDDSEDPLSFPVAPPSGSN